MSSGSTLSMGPMVKVIKQLGRDERESKLRPTEAVEGPMLIKKLRMQKPLQNKCIVRRLC